MVWRQICLWLLPLAVVSVVGMVLAGELAVPTYEVVELKKKLFQEEPAPEIQLEVGARPEAGSLLRTGSGSSADIFCPDHQALFRLGSKTRARLSGEVPGVLLVLEKGRLHALFDKLIGGQQRERVVATPSAVLAVRGTEYGLEVDGKGNTTITVFKGEVEVRHMDGLGETIRVRAGQYSRIRKNKPPQPAKQHNMGPSDWDRGQRPDDSMSHGGPDDTMGGGAGGQSGGSSSGSGGGSSSGSGGGGSRGGGGRG